MNNSSQKNKTSFNFIRSKNWKLYIILTLLFSIKVFSQYEIPKKPDFIPPIIDSTKTLSDSEVNELAIKLKNYSDTTSTEIFVMLLNTTHNQEIKKYATDLGQKWQIGQKGKDNGIILLIAKEDRQTAIQTGYGVEHLLTDAMSRRIIDQEINPYFKKGQFYNGIDNGITSIFEVLKGEYKQTKNNNKGSSFPIILFVIIVIFLIILSRRNRNGGGGSGGRYSGPDLADMIILSRMGRSGGFGSGSFGSGGSFGGGFGGGGSFGGGGASGGW
jgi:uncharacterized protein